MEIANEEQQIKARHQAVIQNALPVLEFEVGRLKAAVEQRAYTAIVDGKLSPELAQQLWSEYHAYTTLLRRFSFRSK